MIRRLQVKLIAVSMASLTFVLMIIFGIANLHSYYNIVSTADEILDILAVNGGSFFVSESRDPYLDPDWSFYDSEEIPYESRYFSVVLGPDAAIVSADVGQIAAVDQETAEGLALSIISSGRTRGFVDEYRYLVYSENGLTRIIFLDCGRLLYTFKNNMYATVLVAIIGVLATSTLVFFNSKRIIRPIIESYEKQRRFVTDAGHEIKTPLTIINADADILAMELGEDNEWILDIQSQTRRLTELTNNLIMLSRLQESGSEPRTGLFPVSDAVTDTARSFQTLARTRNKSLELAVTPELSMNGSEKSVRQLVSILLDNAVKYAPEGTAIVLTLEKNGKSIHLGTENEAPNVTRDDIGHMFERFYRAEKSHNSRTGGYGIGLSIAQAIVDSHRGKIGATLKDGQRLVITAVFPG